MLKILSLLVISALVLPTHEQSTAPFTPCPDVFEYEAPGTENNRWYGNVNLTTDSTLHSVWLNILLDSKADILGNWLGESKTADNMEYKIENTKIKVHPGPPVTVRFFVQYNPLNKPPRLAAIILNGKEICNASNPLPAVNRPEETTTTKRPSRTRPPDPIRGPAYVQTETPPNPNPNNYPNPNLKPNPNPNPYNIGDVIVKSQPPITRQPTYRPPHRTTTAPYEEEDDYRADDVNPSFPVPFFKDRRPTVPGNTRPTSKYRPERPPTFDGECGKVVRNAALLTVGGRLTLEGQWPWQIALYQTQTVDNKYICGGTLVSRSHVITAAHCVTRRGSNKPANKATFQVYLGKHNLRTSVEGVQIRLVRDIRVFPEYNGSTYARDLAILVLREPVSITDWVRPACLWPDNEIDLYYVIGRNGSVVGWGADDSGVETGELTLVEMPVVDQETCIRSYNEFFGRFTSDYTYCAGYRDGTSVCNGDSGGGMVFRKQGIWFLRGLVSLSVARHNEYRCDPTHYVVFTDLAKFLGWIRENLYIDSGYD